MQVGTRRLGSHGHMGIAHGWLKLVPRAGLLPAQSAWNKRVLVRLGGRPHMSNVLCPWCVLNGTATSLESKLWELERWRSQYDAGQRLLVSLRAACNA